MNTLRIFFFIISTICILASTDAARIPKNEQKLTMRGRVIFPGGSKIPVECDATLIVELQDTSLADAPAKVIARGTGKAIRFPMAFAVKYLPSEVANGRSYSLSVSIRSKTNKLLYINDVHMGVTPSGVSRTTNIDVPVILVKQTTPEFNKRLWPELVGKNGQVAVETIKKETGFKNVMTIKDGSAVTMDYRMDRVRVFVNNKGTVSRVPSIA